MKSKISAEVPEKEYVIKTAETLFVKYGIKSISLDDFLINSGISRKTLHKYFANKKDLVEAVLNDLIERNKNDLQNIEHDSENAVEQIAQLAFLVSKNLEEISPSFLYSLKSAHTDIWDKYLEYFNGYFLGYIEKVLIRGKNEKYFREDIDEKIIGRLCWELIYLQTQKDTFKVSETNQGQVKNQIYTLFMNGILTSDGRHKLTKHLRPLS